ncbi:MAG: thioredoxin family protein [Actinomycetota bacterium]
MLTRPVALVATLIVAVSACASPSADAPESSASAVASEVTTPSTSPTPPAETSAPAESESPSSEAAPSGPGSYITLADYDADRAAYSATDVVLFFNAAWCSTCKEARDNIEADLAGIPSGLTIVVVDFDTATDLRQKYGVTVQHTFVQVDADGNELAKWSGSVTADEIAQNTV